MKKYLLIILFAFVILLASPFLKISSIALAQSASSSATSMASGSAQPSDGTWLSDNDVTFAGKNAVRAQELFNWVLVNYQWSTNDNTLISFWATIRNVVFVFLIILVMVSAFLMIITGGQSLTAMQFIRKFLVVIILITFSFAFVRIFYQIVDVIQSFFIKNPDGQIISSKDLLNISFSYQDFIGYRRYGPDYNESAFISLLLTKLTAATYFVMAGVLIIRKIILWFFITVSPIFPVLLLYFPVRNTAKIWIGEFFRWLLYAPLFAIFLSGLVVLWRQNINVLPFTFDATGAKPSIIYPTAINILLGGPGQKLAIDNNINYPATFAEYIVALLMLWVVIFLPFLLLRIFLDYLASASMNNNAWQYIRNNANKILPSTDFFVNNKQSTPPPPPAPPTYHPTGAARQLPFPTGAAKTIPVAQPATRAQTVATNRSVAATTNRTISQTTQTFNTQNIKNVTQTPLYKSSQTSVATSQLVSFPIPTMRDVAKVETSRLSSSISSHQEISKVNETLQKIANPQSITNPVERQQYTTIKEKLVQAQKQGEPLATSILHAANNVTNVTNVTHQAVNTVQQTFQKIANSQSITNTTEKQQVNEFKEKLTEQSKQGNSYATTVLSTISNLSHQSTQQSSAQVQQVIEKLARPEIIKDAKEREQITQLKQGIVGESKKGNPIATSILSATDKVAQASQSAQGVIPATNQVQTVNLEDYEEVKKTWTENYRNLEVPKTLDKADRTREEWVKEDLNKTTHAIDLLGSQDAQKVQEGMGEVSALLPFLLLGGFSQTEIVAYLQAKKHAAEEVLSETQQKSQDEETLLDRKTQTHHAQANMHMQASLSNASNDTSNDFERDEDNPLYNVTHVINSAQNIQSVPQLKETSSSQTMQLVNFSIPTMKDVAKYEAAKLRSQSPERTQVDQMHDMLRKLANPEVITDKKERETYTVMKAQLASAQAKGDPLAASILSTTENISNIQQISTLTQDSFHETLLKLSDPKAISDKKTQETFTSLKEKIVEEKEKNNPLAVTLSTILTGVKNITPSSTQNEIQLHELLLQEKQKNNPLAGVLVAAVDQTIKEQKLEKKPLVNLPEINQVQTVNLEDYEEVRKTWEENYKTLPVPKSLDKPDQNRAEWIKQDVAKTANVISLLTSTDPEKKKEGMQLVAELLPFLLLGGFSEAEVISYLQAKKHAGEEVEKNVNDNESEKDTLVDANKKETPVEKHMQEELLVEDTRLQAKETNTKENE
ncbi:MAG TPA: hypothetical protein VLF89_00665 [Candidatus Saccharimonadales bacterium]|nr:hypothetical protein [Candidatus Saccharimonadales bacterium]